MRSSTKDILAAVFCLLFALAFQVQTGELEGISLYFPRMLLIFITALSLVLLGNALLKIRKEQRQAGDDEPVSWPRVGLISAGSIAYVAIIPMLGFYPTSAVFLFGMAWLLRDKSDPTRKTMIAASLFTIVLCLSVWGGFTLLLDVPTPESIFSQEG